MRITKKSQNALEFMIILMFIFIIIGWLMYIFGGYLVDIKNKEQEMQADSFAQNINKEIAILSKVEPGYYRELKVTSNNYVVNTSHPGKLIIIDLNNNNKTYYFDIIGTYNITLINRTEAGKNETYLVFEKEKIQDYDGIKLN